MLTRKYDVHRLYVIKENKGGIVHFYIGVATLSDNTFVEILNGKKIVVDHLDNVKPLANYYSLLEVRNYSNGKSLMLTREDILKKTIQINADYAIERYEAEKERQLDNTANITDLDERLHKATVRFFPKSGSWGSNEFRKDEHSLIQHLRDDKWLARELQQNKELKDIYYGIIYNYVKTSVFFHKERHAYEQRIVKWQIEWMMSGGDGWLVSDEFGGDFIKFDENYDIGFRLGIYRTLRAIQMDSETIEEGIEVNANLWRDICMRESFRNIYAPILGFAGVKYNQMVPPSDEHLEAWLKLRKYQYYQAHKVVVDKYGEVTPEMKMSLEEVEELKNYLVKMHEKRIAYLEELKNAKVEGTSTEIPFTLAKNKNS